MNKLYDYIKTSLGNKPSIQKIIVMTPQIIEYIQKIGTIQKMTGQEKKLLLFENLKKVISDLDLKDEEKKNIEEFIDGELPFIVDTVVFAYKSKAFQHIKNKTKKCIGRCCK